MLIHRDLPAQPIGVGTAACRDSSCLLWGLILEADLGVQHQPLQVRMVKATLGTSFLINHDLGPTRSVTSGQVIVPSTEFRNKLWCLCSPTGCLGQVEPPGGRKLSDQTEPGQTSCRWGSVLRQLLCPSDFCRPPCICFSLVPWDYPFPWWISPQICKIRRAVNVEYELGLCYPHSGHCGDSCSIHNFWNPGVCSLPFPYSFLKRSWQLLTFLKSWFSKYIF